MWLQPLSVGDILVLSQTAWKIGRAFTHGRKSAPAEFAEVEREANGLSEALKLVAETLHADDSILSAAPSDTQAGVHTIFESARATLDDLNSFVERYQVIRRTKTSGGFTVERSWSEVVLANYKTLQWTTEGGDITELRNMLQMHTSSISLTLQALQSRSLRRLEKTVVPMAENIASIHERVNGDLGDKIDDLHRVIMSIANSTPSLVAVDRALDWRGSDSNLHLLEDDQLNGAEDRMLEPAPLRTSTTQMQPFRASPSSRGSRGSLDRLAMATSEDSRPSRGDSAYYSSETTSSPIKVPVMDWAFESGSPIGPRSSIGGPFELDDLPTAANVTPAPVDVKLRRQSRARRESATLPCIANATEGIDSGSSSSGFRRSTERPDLDAADYNASAGNRQPTGRSPNGAWVPILATSNGHDKEVSLKTSATALSLLSRGTELASSTDTPASPSSLTTNLWHEQNATLQRSIYVERSDFDRHLFRNAAILCEVRGKLVEHAQIDPDEPDPRYSVKMVTASKEARICVIRKRENREHGGTRLATSVWCLSDDGQIRLQQKLPELQETVPYSSYFEPEKVSLQQSTDTPIALRLHGEEWGETLKEEIKTNWVNYYFVSSSDAVAFQSAVFGRTLIGSFRTTKTTVIHDGLKGAFAFEEQFANIETLRLWEDIEEPGAVVALMHYSSNFGEGWARWWLNNSRQPIKIREDGAKHVKVKGIDVKAVRPGTSSGAIERARSASIGSNGQATAATSQKAPLKRVNGVRIEFKTEAERTRFISAAKKAQEQPRPLPDL